MKLTKLHLLIIAMTGLLASTSFGAWGLFDADRSYIGFNSSNGSLNYTVWNSGAGNFNGASLGTFSSSGNLTLSYYDVKTFKNGGSDVTGGTFFWRVYQVGFTPGSFNSIALNFIQNIGVSGDQKWGFSGATTNILSGLNFSSGLKNYKLEVYTQVNGTNPNTSVFDNNGGANYIANLSTVPEPSTFALIGLGALAAGLAMRRRKNG